MSYRPGGWATIHCAARHRAPGEIVPAVGPVDDLQALAHAAEEHRVLPDDIAGPHRLDANLFIGARPR